MGLPVGTALMPKHLRFAGLQRRTIRAYRMALDRFYAFARAEHLPLKTSVQLDFAVSEYMNALFQEGDSLAQAGHLLSGLKRFCPEYRLSLPTATQYYKNWKRIHRPQRAVPIHWELLQALAGACLLMDYPSVALMFYVGFFCFLRTSEMLSLQMFHLMYHSHRPQITVVIPFAKTSNGNAQVLTFTEPLVHAFGPPRCFHGPTGCVPMEGPCRVFPYLLGPSPTSGPLHGRGLLTLRHPPGRRYLAFLGKCQH